MLQLYSFREVCNKTETDIHVWKLYVSEWNGILSQLIPFFSVPSRLTDLALLEIPPSELLISWSTLSVSLSSADFLEIEVRRRDNDKLTFHRHKVHREKDGKGANKY